MRLIEDNLHHIQNKIHVLEQKNNREKNVVALLAVSKAKPVKLIQQAYAAGQKCFGENYVQEALEKIEVLTPVLPSVEWHLIGKLQSNKAKQVAEKFDWVQTIDSIRLAKKLNDFRLDHLPQLNVCIQVNMTDELQKSGVALDEVKVLAKQINQLPKLQLRGLMAIGFFGDDQKNKSIYQRLHDGFLALKSDFPSVDTLSLGMSEDMALAIEHGSTMVRIGRAIFGSRGFSR